jgi:hypothetical protein
MLTFSRWRLATLTRPYAMVLLTVLLLAPAAPAQHAISLMTPREAWSFDNGREFPGATGGLTFEREARGKGNDGLKLVGDFTRGGQYVQAGRKIDKVDIRELSLWVRNRDGARFVLRLNDASGQTHQINLRLEATPDWQRVVFPLERFFARRGQADAVTSVTKYESWGGAKDGRWHGPATALYLLLGNPGDKKAHTLWFDDIVLLPRPMAVAGAEVVSVLPLDEIVEGEHDWGFSTGGEFPGARGALTVVKDQPAPGQACLKLAGDFTGGGAYVAAIKNLRDLGAADVRAIRLRVKSATGASLRIQLKDGSGQTHQRPPLTIPADDQWHDLVVVPTQLAGGEHWGGANDGTWHGPPQQMAVSLSAGTGAKGKQPVVYIANVRAEALLPVFVQPAAFTNSFEGSARLAGSWTIEGAVAIDTKTAFKGNHSLVLTRSLAAVERPCAATSPAFAAAPGQWQIGLATRADLHSPDNSYSGVVTLECLDAQGKVVERFTLADVFGKRDWQPVSKRLELPKGVAAARFHVQLNKTYGRFWVDELSAAYLAPAPRKDDRIARVLFTTARLGNLLLPSDPRQVSVTVEAIKPLRDDQLHLTWEVRDYWGAEQQRTRTVPLTRTAKKDKRYVYQSAIDLGDVPLEVGRYYELHAAIPQAGAEPFRNFTAFAVLPEAETRRYRPEEIPFTSRNWDNRISEYFALSDRLGLRTCGVWGGWSAKPPYLAEAPNIELCKKFGMGVLTGTPVATIERGKKEYDETALRQGVRNFLQKYGKYRPLTISLGNEPHGTGDRVRANVAAYKAVYEEIKKVDPGVVVVATAVEPNEEYFRAGYGKWCDVYDFHVYEGFKNVRNNIEQYQALMKKYGQVRPIWSTELGLNSQGLPRHEVAVELLKTFTTFFAAGGENASWFGLLYPDADGKSFGSSGDSHNVFDCRYNRYAPRLDAVAYYHAVNAIAIKKFKEEKHYPDGLSAFLFRDRDNRTLQVLWKNKGRQDVLVPLAGVEQVQVLRIDGSRRILHAAGKGITLSITEDPLLLLYDGGAALAPTLGTPAATLQAPPRTVARRGPFTLTVALDRPSADRVNLVAPPFWTVQKEPGKGHVAFRLTPPKASSLREVDLLVTLDDAHGKRRGELYHRAVVEE